MQTFVRIEGTLVPATRHVRVMGAWVPPVSPPILDNLRLEIGGEPPELLFDASQDGEAFWSVTAEPAADGPAVGEGGIIDGSFLLEAGPNEEPISFEGLEPGSYVLNIAMRNAYGTWSNVLTAALVVTADEASVTGGEDTMTFTGYTAGSEGYGGVTGGEDTMTFAAEE